MTSRKLLDPTYGNGTLPRLEERPKSCIVTALRLPELERAQLPRTAGVLPDHVVEGAGNSSDTCLSDHSVKGDQMTPPCWY
jgi:hypothetical protein